MHERISHTDSCSQCIRGSSSYYASSNVQWGIWIQWTGMMEWNGGMDYCSGVLDWTTGVPRPQYWQGRSWLKHDMPALWRGQNHWQDLARHNDFRYHTTAMSAVLWWLNEEAEYKRGVARSENGRQETDCSKIQKCLRASCTMNTHYTHIALFEAQNKANGAQNTWYF